MKPESRLVLLHGWASTARVWQPVVHELHAGYECVTVELPGHGQSHLTATRLEPLARQVVDCLQGPAIWLGWSLGALIAMQAALIAPSMVQQLLLVSGTPSFMQHRPGQVAMAEPTFRDFQGEFASRPERTLQRFIALQAHGDSHARQVMDQLRQSATRLPAEIDWGLEALRDTDITSELAAIDCPTQCLYGEQDSLVPAGIGETMHMQMQARVTVWPDTGHVPFLSRPLEFVEWVNRARYG